MKRIRFAAGTFAAAVLLAGILTSVPASADSAPQVPWNLGMIGADAAVEAGYTGEGVRVGVIDSGINSHPDFADRLLAGRNFMEETAHPDLTTDEYGHGTRVAGLIAAVAPGAELVPLKITNGGSINVSQLCEAIYEGIDEFGCDVLNLSLGISYERESLRAAVAYAEKKGVVIVAATGNDGTGELYYPAVYETVIGVSAVDEYGAVSNRSNHNESVWIAAPGVRVSTTSHRGGYTEESGCSYAVPHVAGAAAVLKSMDPDLTPEGIRTMLSENAADRGIEGYDEYYGWGILNLSGCVGALPGEEDSPREISMCARDSACPLADFTDLDRSAWYHDGLHYVLAAGMMDGAGDGRFLPDAPTTRAMVVTMLWRNAGEPYVHYAMRFSDVPPDMWYTEAVRWAAAGNIVSGYDAEHFGPDDPVSREQLAAILFRFSGNGGAGADSTDGKSLERFSDAGEISDWALEAMQWAVSNGLITGVSREALAPSSTATRAQTAAIFMRYFCE